MTDLMTQREELTFELSLCDTGFPGSAEEQKETKCILALAKFDTEHPEVLKAIKQDRIDNAPQGWV